MQWNLASRRRGGEGQLTVFFVQSFDFVHVLSFTDDCVVVEHITIGESSEFWTWEFGILTEVESMNCDSNGINDVRDDNRFESGGRGPHSEVEFWDQSNDQLQGSKRKLHLTNRKFIGIYPILQCPRFYKYGLREQMPNRHGPLRAAR